MFSIANLCDQDLNLRRRYVLILLRAIVSYCSCRLSGHAPTPTPTLGGGGGGGGKSFRKVFALGEGRWGSEIFILVGGINFVGWGLRNFEVKIKTA